MVTTLGHHSSSPKCICDLGPVQDSLPRWPTQHLCMNGGWGVDEGSTARTQCPISKPSVHTSWQSGPATLGLAASHQALSYEQKFSKLSGSVTPTMFLWGWRAAYTFGGGPRGAITCASHVR